MSLWRRGHERCMGNNIYHRLCRDNRVLLVERGRAVQMTIFDRIRLGYYLCLALGFIVGVVLTVIAYERFGEEEDEPDDDYELLDIWEEESQWE